MRGVNPALIESAHPGMLGRILGDEHHPASFLLERDDRRAIERREGLPVTVGLLHLPMAEHRPERDVGIERRDVRLRVPADRAAGAQLVVQLVRHAAAVQRRVEQVDVADLVPGHAVLAVTPSSAKAVSEERTPSVPATTAIVASLHRASIGAGTR